MGIKGKRFKGKDILKIYGYDDRRNWRATGLYSVLNNDIQILQDYD